MGEERGCWIPIFLLLPVGTPARKWNWVVTKVSATPEEGINMGRAIYTFVCVCKRLINTKKFIFRHQAVGSITSGWVWKQQDLDFLLYEIVGLPLISSILWWNCCAGACWEGTAPFVSCLSSVSRCLVFFKAWCNTPSLFTVAQSGNRDCFVLFLPFDCTKDFHSFLHLWRAKKGISTPKLNVFLIFPFRECCIRVIWIAMCACPLRMVIRRQTGRAS